jgi:hypothetical protein
MAADAAKAWDMLVPGASGQAEPALQKFVADTLRQHGCLPTQAQERLAEVKIRPTV